METIERRLFSHDSASLNLDDLQQQLVARLAILIATIAGVLALLGLSRLPLALPFLSLSLGVIAVVALAWVVSQRYQRVAQYLLVWGLSALLACALWIYSDPWLPLLALTLIFVAAILFRSAGTSIAIAICVVLYSVWLEINTGREYPLVALIFGLILAIGIARLATNTLFNALRWAWTAQQQADQLLLQSRERQAELSSVLKSLELATYQLEMTNQNLYVARRQTQEAQRTKEQFAANISHELRTPLNVILGFSEMLYISPDVYGNMQWPTSLRQDVYQIYRSSRHLLAMIDDVLELSRFELARFNLNKEATEPDALVQSTIDIVDGLFRDRPITLETDIEPDLPIVEIDRTRIRQVVINLVTNARNYTKAGRVCVTARRGNGEVIISVSDTGPGIPADKLPNIFDAFYQVDTSLRREQGGAGLGLAISKQFVEAHEGRIWAESHEGAGTTIYFSLPVREGGMRTSYPRETDSLKPVIQPERQSILLLDPDPAVAGLLTRHLGDYDIVPVENDEQLAEKVAAHHPRLVICNVPPEKGGRLTTNNNRSVVNYGDVPSGPAEPLVTYVECSLPSRGWIAADLPIKDCLTKPVTAAQLYKELDKLGNVRNILVVDDDRGFAQLVERMFAASHRDLTVRLAFDGREGLEAIRESRPDIVFLDLAMPVMDGFQVLTEIQADPQIASVPVILLTVSSYAEDMMLRHGSQLHVHRPNGLRLVEVLRCLNAIAGAVDQQQIA